MLVKHINNTYTHTPTITTSSMSKECSVSVPYTLPLTRFHHPEVAEDNATVRNSSSVDQLLYLVKLL